MDSKQNSGSHFLFPSYSSDQCSTPCRVGQGQDQLSQDRRPLLGETSAMTSGGEPSYIPQTAGQFEEGFSNGSLEGPDSFCGFCSSPVIHRTRSTEEYLLQPTESQFDLLHPPYHSVLENTVVVQSTKDNPSTTSWSFQSGTELDGSVSDPKKTLMTCSSLLSDRSENHEIQLQPTTSVTSFSNGAFDSILPPSSVAASSSSASRAGMSSSAEITDDTLISALAESLPLEILNALSDDRVNSVNFLPTSEGGDWPAVIQNVNRSLRPSLLLQNLLSYILTNGLSLADTIERGVAVAASTATSAAAIFRESFPFSNPIHQHHNSNTYTRENQAPSGIAAVTAAVMGMNFSEAQAVQDHHLPYIPIDTNSTTLSPCYQEHSSCVVGNSNNEEISNSGSNGANTSPISLSSLLKEASCSTEEGESFQNFPVQAAHDKTASCGNPISSTNYLSFFDQTSARNQAEAVLSTMITTLMTSRAGVGVTNAAAVLWQLFQGALSEMGKLQCTVSSMRSTISQLTERLETATLGLNEARRKLHDATEPRYKGNQMLHSANHPNQITLGQYSHMNQSHFQCTFDQSPSYDIKAESPASRPFIPPPPPPPTSITKNSLPPTKIKGMNHVPKVPPPPPPPKTPRPRTSLLELNPEQSPFSSCSPNHSRNSTNTHFSTSATAISTTVTKPSHQNSSSHSSNWMAQTRGRHHLSSRSQATKSHPHKAADSSNASDGTTSRERSIQSITPSIQNLNMDRLPYSSPPYSENDDIFPLQNRSAVSADVQPFNHDCSSRPLHGVLTSYSESTQASSAPTSPSTPGACETQNIIRYPHSVSSKLDKVQEILSSSVSQRSSLVPLFTMDRQESRPSPSSLISDSDSW